ncbi:MAG: hypothetical protein AVDCRST_MAG21-1212 [uncultured Nocardioidaceae bacterium]|uniref:Sulfotransferase domain-containing protein n=1 Tax=uncultured Nocardioidaceae bacterium TaxID=253824 RepID=A0A6J4MYZ2_9ACTN|nr:MAG: hypothetical protein AVDCRST_MAG21-1212 [uncultured Nocardioidaceae bacterium]
MFKTTADSSARSAAECFLHVGLPKTGTTHLQGLLWHNRDALAEQGLRYPGPRQKAHWAAAMDLLGARLPGVPGAWPSMLERVHSWPGRVNISHEMMAALEPETIEEVVEALAPKDVHVIVTIRDLSRSVPATWQERAKNREVEPWLDFLDAVGRGPQGGHLFWRLQDAAAILRRWAAVVPSGKIHVVTVPASSADRGLLVQRYARVIGVDPDRLTVSPRRSNESLGAVEVMALQHINAQTEDMPWEAYRSSVKQHVAQKLLAARPGQQRVVVPESTRGWIQTETDRVIDTVGELGCAVEGDLADLAPAGFGPPKDESSTDRPDQVRPELVAEALSAVTADLVKELARLRRKTANAAAQPPTDQHGQRRRPRPKAAADR